MERKILQKNWAAYDALHPPTGRVAPAPVTPVAPASKPPKIPKPAVLPIGMTVSPVPMTPAPSPTIPSYARPSAASKPLHTSKIPKPKKPKRLHRTKPKKPRLHHARPRYASSGARRSLRRHR